MTGISEAAITNAVAALNNGGVIVYPTETVYGIGCDPFDRSACERVQHLKKRADSKTLLLLACSLDQVEETAGALPQKALVLARVFWPGPLTIVLRPEKPLPGHLLGPSAGVAFRVTPHPVAAEIALRFGRPVTSTSANATGGEPILRYEDAITAFGDSAYVVLPDPGPMGGIPSTVVDVTSGEAVVLREGGVTAEEIVKVTG